MKRRRQYLLTLTDEVRLVQTGSLRLTAGKAAAAAVGLLVLCALLGVAAICLTPLKTLLPGYMRESQRAASEEMSLRLDSLHAAYERNEAYLRNISTVFDTSRIPSDSTHATSHTNRPTPDSLLTASTDERKFVKMMQEREKYNISVIAPLAAEGLMFYPPADEAVYPEASRKDLKLQAYLPEGSTTASPADGTVLAIYSPKLDGSYTIVVQHPKNFVSRLSGLGTPLVGEGDHVSGGQAVALGPPPAAGRARAVVIELWHNGTSLSPYSYVEGYGVSTSE